MPINDTAVCGSGVEVWCGGVVLRYGGVGLHCVGLVVYRFYVGMSCGGV